MRITQVLLKQHIGFAFKRNWIFQRKKRPFNSKCEEVLQQKGFTVLEANQYIKNIETNERLKGLDFNIQVIGMYQKEPPKDEYHPEYREKVCHLMKTNNVLVEGLPQAQIITKTHLVTADQLPDKLENAAKVQQAPEIHDRMKKILLFSNVFDCEQRKLPKIKDPERPAHIFARVYGIVDTRRNLLTTAKMVNLIEKSNDTNKHMNAERRIECITSFKKDDDLYQLQFDTDVLITSDKPLSPIQTDYKETTPHETLPDLYPMTHRVSFPTENFYKFEDVYPIKDKTNRFYNPHTTILHHNATELGNLYDVPVSEKQLWGRSLLHAFTVASSYAKSLHGENVQLLPEPVTVQCVQTDGCNFYLGVFQLNTLDLNGVDGVKNLWYQKPTMKMFDSCKYDNAVPVLKGYNPSVLNYLSAMYRNN